MAHGKLLFKRLSDGYRILSPAVTLQRSQFQPPNAAKNNVHREQMNLQDASEKGFLTRFLYRRPINQLPDFLPIPVGEKLTESLKGISITGDRFHFDGLAPPSKESPARDPNVFGISVQDARKLLRLSQMEKLKLRLREMSENSIPYIEFVRICVEESENEEQGAEFASMLDQNGNVILLGSIVFLRPEQVAKSMENIISQSIGTGNDPSRKHWEDMEQQKALIDQKARAQVRGELYCGLGFLLLQTLGFMRLTFWELSWDVMEPICFFVTSLNFALAYGFFVRTSVEPSFEGYFERRFKTKQKKLMKIHNFNIHKYNELRKAFYLDSNHEFPHSQYYNPINGEEGIFLSSVYN